MGRPKGRNVESASFSLSIKTLGRLNEYSQKTMIPKTRLVEKALDEYLDKVEKAEGQA